MNNFSKFSAENALKIMNALFLGMNLPKTMQQATFTI